jgi:hypothetical protein
MCKQAFHTHAEVKDQVPQFKDLINEVLIGTFHLILPSSFKKVQGTFSFVDNKTNEPKRGGGKDGDKKRKNEQGNSNLVKNTGQPDKFKATDGETWKRTFSKMLPQDQPAWNDKLKMCALWYIKGDCNTDCSRAISNIMRENIPNDKKEVFLIFMAIAGRNAKRTRSQLDSSDWGLAASDHQENHPNFLYPSFLAPRLWMDRKSLQPNQYKALFLFHPNDLTYSQLPMFQTLEKTSALLDINHKSRKHVRTQF